MTSSIAAIVSSMHQDFDNEYIQLKGLKALCQYSERPQIVEYEEATTALAGTLIAMHKHTASEEVQQCGLCVMLLLWDAFQRAHARHMWDSVMQFVHTAMETHALCANVWLLGLCVMVLTAVGNRKAMCKFKDPMAICHHAMRVFADEDAVVCMAMRLLTQVTAFGTFAVTPCVLDVVLEGMLSQLAELDEDYACCALMVAHRAMSRLGSRHTRDQLWVTHGTRVAFAMFRVSRLHSNLYTIRPLNPCPRGLALQVLTESNHS